MGSNTCWDDFRALVADLKENDIPDVAKEGLRLLQLEWDQFVGNYDRDTCDKDADVVNTVEMKEQFVDIYTACQKNIMQAMGMIWIPIENKNSKVKFVQQWYKAFNKYKKQFIEKQQRYVTKVGCGSPQEAMLALQIHEKMRQIQTKEVEKINRTIVSEFESYLKHRYKRDTSKLKCIVEDVDLSGKYIIDKYS